MNEILAQSTCLILFRSISNFSSLKRWLKSYEIPLKSSQDLFQVFRSVTLTEPHAYLIIDISPHLKHPRVFTHILMNDPRPLLIFSVEEES